MYNFKDFKKKKLKIFIIMKFFCRTKQVCWVSKFVWHWFFISGMFKELKKVLILCFETFFLSYGYMLKIWVIVTLFQGVESIFY